MTLPNSGPLSLSMIKAEFGGNASPKLSDYYAGGAFVPSGTTGVNGAVPSSGPLSMSKFYGTSNFVPHSDDFTAPVAGATIPVPSGAVQVIMEVWGGGGPGGHGASGGLDHQGGGGSSGGYVKHILALSADAGKVLTYTVGAAGANSTVTGALTNGSPNLTGGGGFAGGNATGTTDGAGGTPGGSATGGNTANVVGNVGLAGNNIGTGGQGGAANNGYATGGKGGYTSSDTGRNTGLQAGRVKFTWS